jgi:hypothetical protein
LNKIGEAGRRAERAAAKALDMDLTPASGASGIKGDLRDRMFRAEVKSTEKDSISVKLADLYKISDEAFGADVYPALVVCYTQKDGKIRERGRWVMVPDWVWTNMRLG